MGFGSIVLVFVCTLMFRHFDDSRLKVYATQNLFVLCFDGKFALTFDLSSTSLIYIAPFFNWSLPKINLCYIADTSSFKKSY